MYSTYSDLLKANRELKTDISGLEQTVSEANQIFNKITDQLKEGTGTLEEKSNVTFVLKAERKSGLKLGFNFRKKAGELEGDRQH